MGELTWASFADDPDLVDVAHAVEADLPPFLAELTSPARRGLDGAAPGQQWVVAEADIAADPLPVAVVRTVALRWSGAAGDCPAGGAAEALDRVAGHPGGIEPGADTLVVLDVAVAYGARGRGVGRAILDGLPARRASGGWTRSLVLVRPHAKSAYPLVPFARYTSFVRDDGLPFDPWFRSAWQAGLVPVAAVDRSLVARADLASWRRWAGRPIPGSGPYLVEGAIKPAIVEVERGEGRYREPHLWMAPRDGVAVGDRGDGWLAALERAGLTPGDRSHREVRRPR